MKFKYIIPILILFAIAGCTVDNTSVPNTERPEQPSNPSPAHESTVNTRTSTLSWSCSDPDNDPLHYMVYLSNVEEFDSEYDILEDYTVSTSVTSFSLSPATKYYWRVIVMDSEGATELSPVWEFTTANNLGESPPRVPSDPDPYDGETDVATTGRLSWSGGDIEGDAVTYSVYLGTSNPPGFFGTTTSTTINYSDLSEFTDCYWKVEATDNDGTTEGPVWMFRTGSASAGGSVPYEPSDPSPFDGETSVSTTTSLTWSGGDPDGDDVTYNVYFSRFNPPSFVTSTINRSYTPTNMNDFSNYYWKIVAVDGDGTTEGPVWHFETGAESPVLLDDGFEDYDINAHPTGGWRADQDSPSYVRVSNTRSFSGSQSLEFYDEIPGVTEVDNYCWARYTHTPVTRGTVEFKIFLEEFGAFGVNGYHAEDSDGWDYATFNVVFNSNGQIMAADGGTLASTNYVSLMESYPLFSWISIKVEFDMNNSRYDVFINDILYGENLEFHGGNSFSTVSDIRFIAYSDSEIDRVFIDNVHVERTDF